MLRPASGFFVPWHSKQYFWKVPGGTAEGRDAAGGRGVCAGRSTGVDAARRGAVAGAWADRIDASVTAPATLKPERVIALPGEWPVRPRVQKTGQLL
jgi:hypothetical protein